MYGFCCSCCTMPCCQIKVLINLIRFSATQEENDLSRRSGPGGPSLSHDADVHHWRLEKQREGGEFQGVAIQGSESSQRICAAALRERGCIGFNWRPVLWGWQNDQGENRPGGVLALICFFECSIRYWVWPVVVSAIWIYRKRRTRPFHLQRTL